MSIHYQDQAPVPERRLGPALRAGWRQRCPSCATGKVFWKYLKVNDTCPSCGLELHHHRADDAPPYFTILIVGHIVVPLALEMQMALSPPIWVLYSIWLPATLIMALWLLPRVKSMLIAFQWARGMHGFGEAPPELDDAPILVPENPLSDR